jgi:hypothetical protein
MEGEGSSGVGELESWGVTEQETPLYPLPFNLYPLHPHSPTPQLRHCLAKFAIVSIEREY